LVWVYAFDSPTRLRYLQEGELKKLEIGEEELRPLAVKNLDRILTRKHLRAGDGVYMLEVGGNFESSMLLLTEFWSDQRIQVRGDVVVAVPTRDMVLITGSEDADNLKLLREIAQEGQEQAYPLSTDLWKFTGKGFVLLPPEASPGTP